jgi:HEAT repeat protein
MSITAESVRQLLSSEDLGDRLRGVNQLRELEPAIAYELVQTPINDKNPRVRYAAISQMDTLGDQDLPKSLTILRDRLLNDSEVDVKAAAADCLGALKLTDAFEDLRQSYQNTSEWMLQFSIIATLGELGDLRAFELLQEALGSNVELITTAAISALGELGDLRAIPLLRAYITHPDWQLRYRLVYALHNLAGPETRSLLEALAQDPFEQVAQAAQTCLQSG